MVTTSQINELLQSFDGTIAVKVIDILLDGWIAGPGASDDLSSPMERAEIMHYYRHIKELLTKIDLLNRHINWTSENSQN